ncbi:potassium channel family protein, partial [bacterium]|nr:potassium channel family protein [bacterium]
MTKVKIFLKKLIEKAKGNWNYLKKRNILLLLLVLLLLILAGGTLAFFFEKGVNEGLRSLGDACWWAIVTLTTVGYGDKVPLTLGGRLVGVFLMFAGISLITLLTATVSSVFVEKKIRE